ncbi:hypothetical protein [Streptomyces sp. NPDC002133]|uniref:hypothetical protein n=1 Tax=Streptomyces sp. NPDC002133 TaxID=3154409 RepID=UPI003329514D
MTKARALCAIAAALLLGAAATACTSGSPDDDPAQGSTSVTPAPDPSTAPPTTGPPTPLPPSPSGSGSPPGSPSDSPSPSSPAPPPTVLTEADSGLTVTLAVGATVPLRLDSRLRWETPSTSGRAVTLVPVAYESDPGYREWELRAERPGETVVRTTGTGRSGPLDVRITVRVSR